MPGLGSGPAPVWDRPCEPDPWEVAQHQRAADGDVYAGPLLLFVTLLEQMANTAGRVSFDTYRVQLGHLEALAAHLFDVGQPFEGGGGS